ncbi:metal-dependent hydrolase [Bacillus luteolus]|uniref:Metal-dependent hydrolase n=1 Tax=Litchfieldia luteola TaxID=682179 RepID=A0ABR9QQ68_9BACI|nr:metal-dependent hydrolase [Cytobacillus luteolus]MBE4910599.1 metal-dependent hydrolase [Cytobacillus luteolus]MBP1943777.1 inner membrane protein [Cytobacillus luteolus]
MDTITHTMFGLTLYGSIDKKGMDKDMKRSLFITSIVGSQIPDIDVVSQLWDSEGMYQMWHRGITHSLFLVPLWALLIWGLCYLLFKVKDKRIFYTGLVAVFIHNTADLFNAWGTGYFEPISQMRITFGTIPIIDFVYWTIMIGAFIFTRYAKENKHRIFKLAWILMILHVSIQSAQGYLIYNEHEKEYDQLALSASFIPWNYSIIGKKENVVEIKDVSLFTGATHKHTLESQEDANLDQLFSERPEAKTLYQWSPFVVVVDDDERLGVYDPRFYRGGQSFLFEYIEKQ